MEKKSIQDYYPDKFAHCYGCGRLNQDGLKIKSYWDGKESVCHYTPRPYYTEGIPGYAYGGLIASLIDCHAAATASAGTFHDKGYSLEEKPLSRFVAASLTVDYLKPTPIGTTLELRGKIKEIKGRKVIVTVTLSAEGEICAEGEEILVRMKEK